MNLPKITIITPSFNQGQYIEKTILSVLNQNYPNLEYIIIDGGSTDGTVEIIKKYQQHITYWISESDKGQSDAINKGLKLASGDIINWLNSDDYLENNVLQKIANDFSSINVDILCGYSKIISANGISKKRTSKLGNNFAQFISQGQIMQPSTFFRKHIFDEFTPLELSLHFMMDHYVWLLYISKYHTEKIKYVDYTISFVLVHENAKSFKMINLFQNDREMIYSSMFKSMNLKWVYPYKNNTTYISFNYPSELIKQHGSEINFYLLIDLIFIRDAFGNRGRINLNNLIRVFYYFPIKSINYLLKKTIH